MKRHIKSTFLFLVCITAFTLLLYGCSSGNGAADGGKTDTDSDVTVTNVSIDMSTIPTDAVVGQVDLSKIILKIETDDGKTKDVKLTNDMIAVADRTKFTAPITEAKTYSVSVIYEKRTAKFNITLYPAPIVYCDLQIGVEDATSGEVWSEVAKDEFGVLLTIVDDLGNTLSGKNVLSGTYKAGSSLTITASVPNGYNLSEWQTVGELLNRNVSFKYTINDDADIFAIVGAMTYSVNFISYGGTNVPSVTTNELTDCPIPIRSDYIFVGWHQMADLSDNPITFPYVVSMTTTLYAAWKAQGLIYEPYKDGYMVVNYTGNDRTLQIPNTYNDKQVLKIAAGAFDSAVSLEEITIQRYLIEIDPYAFYKCINLNRFIVDNSNSTFKTINDVLYSKNSENDTLNLFSYPSGLLDDRFVVQQGVVKICAGAFYNANIACIEVGSDIINIEDYAFYSPHLDYVRFPSDVPDSMLAGEQSLSREGLFHENIAHIFVSEEYLASYRSAPIFSPYLGNIERAFESDITAVGIYNNEFIYRIIENPYSAYARSVEIIGANRSMTSAVIVETINSTKVTSIAKNAFGFCYKLESVTFNSTGSLERIDRQAFENTPWLNKEAITGSAGKRNGLLVANKVVYCCLEEKESQIITSDIIRIAQSAFSRNKKLKSVVFSESSLTKIDVFAFDGCENLTSFALPLSVSFIGAYAFANTNLENFSISSDSLLETVGEGAFQNARRLKSMFFGVNVTNIGGADKDVGSVFSGCVSLMNIDVAENNTVYVSRDGGVLYQYNLGGDTIDRTGTILLCYPAGKLLLDYTVPVDVKIIKSGAFSYSNFIGLNIPATLTEIDTNSIIVPQLVYLRFYGSSDKKFYRDQDKYRVILPEFDCQYYVVPSAEDMSFMPGIGAPSSVRCCYMTDAENWKTSSWKDANDSIIFPTSTWGVMDSEGHPVDLSVTGNIDLCTEINFVYEYSLNGLFILATNRNHSTISVPSLLSTDSEDKEVKRIMSYSFLGDIIETVILPNDVDFLDKYAFYHCTSLSELTLMQNIPPTIIYDGTTPLSINNKIMYDFIIYYVPTGCVNAYVGAWALDESYVIQFGSAPGISFDSKGGTEVDFGIDTNGVEDGKLDVLPVSTRVGYEFYGWYEGYSLQDGFIGEPLTFPYSTRKNVTLYARWTEIEYNVTYDLGLGEIEFSTDNADISYDSSKETVLIKGTNGKAEIELSEKRIIISGGEQETNRMVFHNGISEMTVASRESVAISLQDRTIVLFMSSEKLKISIVDDTVIVEKYITEIINEENVDILEDKFSFKRSGEVSAESVVAKFGEMYDLDVPTREGYTFKGWYNINKEAYADELGRSFYVWSDAKDMVLYAKWEATKYLVTYDVNGGVRLLQTTREVTFGKDYELITPQRSGYDFVGWKDVNGRNLVYVISGNDMNESINNWDIAENTTVVAAWSPKHYTVTLKDSVLSHNNPPDMTAEVTYGEQFSFPIATFPDNEFFGWYSGIDGTGTQYTDGLGNSVREWDIDVPSPVLYAQWPVTISSAEEFIEKVKDKPEGSYLLTADLDFSDVGWQIIGYNSQHPFSGVIDGNGKKITGVNIVLDNFVKGTDGDIDAIYKSQGAYNDYNQHFCVGMFGFSTGTIRNLDIEMTISVVTGESVYIGGIVGYNRGKIENCDITFSVSAVKLGETTPDIYMGQLVGYHDEDGAIIDTHGVFNVVENGATKPYGNFLPGATSGFGEYTRSEVNSVG